MDTLPAPLPWYFGDNMVARHVVDVLFFVVTNDSIDGYIVDLRHDPAERKRAQCVHFNARGHALEDEIDIHGGADETVAVHGNAAPEGSAYALSFCFGKEGLRHGYGFKYINGFFAKHTALREHIFHVLASA